MFQFRDGTGNQGAEAYVSRFCQDEEFRIGFTGFATIEPN